VVFLDPDLFVSPVSTCERTVTVKKLLVLALVAAFTLASAIGCSSPATTSKAPDTAGSGPKTTAP